MTLLIRGTKIAKYEISDGVNQKLLLNRHETGDSRLEIKKISLNAKANFELRLEQNSLNWLHALTSGLAVDTHKFDTQSLIVLNGGTKIIIENMGDTEAELLFCAVPKVSRYLSQSESIPFDNHLVDWSVEPVLLSEFDSRKRIYLASPHLWQGVSCVKGEMIIYPQGGAAPPHHHEGAEHFQYIMEGSGTVTFNETEHVVEKGDILYFFENELHSFINKEPEEFVFAEFFVPGSYNTIWQKDTNICTWLPTGKDINGKKASRHIEKHVHGEGKNI
jgi:hypothetical protein